ncbi:hypothetical protein [Pelomonas aquatica]|jgi:hypothetical protein|uniref:Uncharacterized protein n=1 Tax=Pelomonas aquatica TaxID=431058 RepID=A0A9X4R366_9BURK|nr:hypothetical protein [Pelomonas aquatica]MDG0860966.1 hypothetical protein [Pelomonas aquatica]
MHPGRSRRLPSILRVKPVPLILSSLLHRTRAAILVLLLVVLPLQSVVQWVAGVQGHRHLHTGAAPQGSVLASLTQPLRAALDRLHAAQDPRLQGPRLGWVVSKGPAAGMHAHGGIFHEHMADTHDVVDVGDPADDSAQGDATAFLAWLPSGVAPLARQVGERPAMVAIDWRDRAIAPPLTPPRG